MVNITGALKSKPKTKMISGILYVLEIWIRFYKSNLNQIVPILYLFVRRKKENQYICSYDTTYYINCKCN